MARPWILEERVQIIAFRRRLGEPREGVRRQENEQKKRGRDPGLHGQHIGRKSSGMERENKATAAANSERTSTHKSIEPS